MDYSPSKYEKCAFFDQNAWTIAHQIDKIARFLMKMD